jgi:YHS domain-containing protein
MKSRNVVITCAAFALLPELMVAQQVQQPDAAQPAATALTSCAQVQPAVENIIAGAMTRLEGARQTNDPAQMRAAVDHLGSALRDIRTQLAPCAAPAAAGPHAGHAMPKTTPPPAPPTAKPGTAADPHAGHEMATKKPAPVTPSTKPPATATKPKPAATPDPHAGHKMPPAGKTPTTPKSTTTKPPAKGTDPHAAHAEAPAAKQERDPVNGLMVDPANSPKTTYQGRTYYFSSEQSLKQFLENPAKFAKPPKK